MATTRTGSSDRAEEETLFDDASRIVGAFGHRARSIANPTNKNKTQKKKKKKKKKTLGGNLSLIKKKKNKKKKRTKKKKTTNNKKKTKIKK
eukprot:NODE_21420_length_754_cov_3.047847.p2 GENE.NODE_21420_length_754_cov_3.047847~~NODE_21420_length_754_cov_3.047847.p2  ORF type:complete len:91 (+),score=42.85 NODE_21420_length_754_cov_3.047847:437-709(+)